MSRTRVATLIVAPVRDLMHQWHQRILRKLGYDAGVVGDSLFNLLPVTVTTYDSAYLHMAEMGDKFGSSFLTKFITCRARATVRRRHFVQRRFAWD
jgi:superfamily II DNA or RNA helicase